MLSRRSLPLRSAWFYRLSNLPILLGVMLACAVLTGSLILGDSLRGSLRERALRKLNGIETSYLGTRLVSENRATQMPGEVIPAMILQGSVAAGDRRVNRVTVIGLSPEGAVELGIPGITNSQPPRAMLSLRVAMALKYQTRDKIELAVEKFSAVPRSSLLGAKSLDQVTTKVTLDVNTFLPSDHPANDFDLTPNPAAPLNIFVPLEYLQKRLDKPGRVNALLGRGAEVQAVNAAFHKNLTLEDWMIRLQTTTKRNAYISVESEQLVLDASTVKAIEAAAQELGYPCERTLSYLANTITQGPEPVLGRDVGTGRKMVAYSVVAGLEVDAKAPLGPFLPTWGNRLQEDEILLADWGASPLKGLAIGEKISVAFFKPEMEASAEETFAVFRLCGYVPLTGVAADPNLTPPFPGITDKLKIGDWESPFEMETKRIQRRDEDYWNQFKTTPKAYISTAAAEKLFGSRFGTVTSLRIAPPAGKTVAEIEPVLRAKILEKLEPMSVGLQFQATRTRLLETSQGGTDFGAMFLFFSVLLIGSTLLLVGLLFRLAIEKRAKEVGLLLATGYTPREVRRSLTTEGLLIAIGGAILGLIVSVGYAGQMLQVLVALWPDAEVGSYLGLHVNWWSPLLGFMLTVFTAWLTIRLSLRGMLDVPPPMLLRGRTRLESSTGRNVSRRAILFVGMLVLLALASLAIGPTRTNPDERAGAFFTGGLLLLAAGLFTGRILLLRASSQPMARSGFMALANLGFRNAAGNSTRTLLSAALMAGSMFLVVSVESFRRKPDAEFALPTGGSGGLPWIVETDVPVFQNFDRDPGREDLLESLTKVFQKQSTGPSVNDRLAHAKTELTGITAFPFRLRGGDDASCLNLSQAGEPRIVGVPDALITRGGFRFTQTLAKSAEERANPWLLLQKPLEPLADGRVPVPVIAEQNTVFFMLKTFPGGIVEIPDESGAKIPVKIVGLLQDSVFQSDLLMGDVAFGKLFPRTEGYRIFLLDLPAEKDATVPQLLEAGLRQHGPTISRSADRVATYQAVVGAYLTTFQLLGALGLLLAILGLSVVILRNVAERGSELALLRAVGYRYTALQAMILSETLVVLALGLVVGIVAALASVLPNLALGGEIPWAKLLGLLAATTITGIVVAGLATWAAARAAIIPALRGD
jgi:putative ABC transport system permease protein